ncbi:MAG TPA: PilN domain-containing protein [Gemmatimonadaceae bacterium]|nr:PilN domain-containing protein [Gemmatimonadaceae bacterium]
MSAPHEVGGEARGRGARSAMLGVALGPEELVGVNLRAASTTGAAAAPWRHPLTPLPAEGSDWPALTAALRALAAWAGVDGGELSVALLPPLAQLATVELPPLRANELRRLVARNAPRYFLGAREPQVVAVELPTRAARGAPAAVTVAAAPARLVDAIHRAAGAAGFTVRTTVPAEAAWRAAALAFWPSLERGVGDVLVHQERRTDLLQLDGGRLVGLRRLRAGDADAAHVRDAVAARAAPGPGGPRIALGAFGDPAGRAALARALAALELQPAPPPPRWREAGDDAALVAATFAARGAGLELVPDALRLARRGRASYLTRLLVAAALLLVVAAGALELWGVRRELAAVEAQRAALRARVGRAAARRVAAERSVAQLAELAALERGATHWPAVLAMLAERLPDDAWLTALRGTGDSVVIEGLAGSAATVFDAVAAAPGVAGVRTAAPVRPDLEEASGTERFTLAVRLAPPLAAPPPPAPAKPRRPRAGGTP